jgi:hypothetical protein
LFPERAATVAPAPGARRAVAMLDATARGACRYLLFSLAILFVTALDAAATEGVVPLRYNGYKVPLLRNLVKRAIRGVEEAKWA